MDRPDQEKTGTAVIERPKGKAKITYNNGHKNGANGNDADAELSLVLASLQNMRDGDFSVRLPGNWTGFREKSPTPSTTSPPPTSRWRRN